MRSDGAVLLGNPWAGNLPAEFICELFEGAIVRIWTALPHTPVRARSNTAHV